MGFNCFEHLLTRAGVILVIYLLPPTPSWGAFFLSFFFLHLKYLFPKNMNCNVRIDVLLHIFTMVQCTSPSLECQLLVISNIVEWLS